MYDNYYASFVNLDHRGDRLTNMLEQQNRISLPMTRTRGMSPDEVFAKKLTTDDQVRAMLKGTQNAIGCHFSQVQVMKDALARDKHAIVFEDDIQFCEDFDKRFEYIHEWTQTHDWDVIWLGASFHCNPPYWHASHGTVDKRYDFVSKRLGKDAELTSDLRMVRTFGAFNTFAYIVNKNSIQKILDLFDQHLPKSEGIDFLFIMIQPDLNCFSFVPGCVKQLDTMSDICHEVRKWSGFLRLNHPNPSDYVYQERLEMFDPLTFPWNEITR